MKRFTAADAAAELNTDAKTVRRIARANFDAPGSGGSWSFTIEDIESLRGLLADKSKPKGKTATAHTITDAPGLSYLEAKDPAKVRAITEARIDRLEAALKATGNHISQIKARDTFRPLMPLAI